MNPLVDSITSNNGVRLDITKAKKISVVGNSGAGKSTLSKKLGKVLGIDVFTVDKIYWQKGWNLSPHEEFKKVHDEWLGSDAWIIDGVGYWSEMEQRLRQSDVVIFLDVDEDVCLQRAQKRIKEEENSPNQDIAEGCVYGDVHDQQMEMIKYFHATLRPKLTGFLSGLDTGSVLTVSCYDELGIGG